MSHLIGVYGASGFGRETMPFVRSFFKDTVGAKFVFVDDAGHEGQVNGHDVFSWDEYLAQDSRSKRMVLAIANSQVRERLWNKCADAGVALSSVQAENAVLLDDVEIADGAILSPFVTLTSNIRIGRGFHANIYSYVAHDCQIGDFVTFAPGVKCNGNVVVEDHAYIGTGAILRQGTPDAPLVIGAGSVVGMGAVVTRDVPPGTTVIGNPARPFKKD